jgi:SAM-dependent methyltransferase
VSREDEARRLADVYSAHAVGYAEGWSPVIRPAGQRLLAALPVRGARRVLDIGTGAGVHIEDVRALEPTACVIGVDRSPGMLALARRHGAPLAVMDGMELAFRDGAFDVAMMTFVLFHLHDPAAALTEVGRALRPGGAVGVTTWADDPEVDATRVFEAELDAAGAVDAAGLPDRRDALMNAPDKLATLLAGAGLQPDRVWLETLEHAWTADALWGLRLGFGRTKRKFDSLPPAERDGVLARIRARWDTLPPEAFVYRASVVCGIARRTVA